MNEDSEPLQQLVNDIKRHVGFLFDRGYEIHSAEKHADASGRTVILKHDNLFLKVFEERGERELSFARDARGFIDIRSIIYFLTENKVLLLGTSTGVEKYANLLREYIDQIEACFGSEYSKSEKGLKSAHRKYREKYDAAQNNAIISAFLSIFSLIIVVVTFGVYNELVGMLFSFWSRDIEPTQMRVAAWAISLLLAVLTAILIRRIIRQKFN